MKRKALFNEKIGNIQKGGGGGEISELRGLNFERAAVNWSGIHGENFPMADGSGPFFATGISLITRHAKSACAHCAYESALHRDAR